MSATTGLGPAGVSRAINASYAGKVASTGSKAAGIYSRLHPGGHSRAWADDAYGGKAPSGGGGKAAGPFSRLHPAGHSRAWADDAYAGKAPSAGGKAAGPFSRLHMAGHSRAFAIDSYAGKSPTTPPVDGEGGNFIPVIARRGRRGR